MANISGARYRESNASVQGSFKRRAHANYAITAVSISSPAIDNDIVLLSATDYYRCEVGGPATVASMILPPGLTPLVITKGQFISFLKLAAASEVSVIIPEA